MGKTDRMRKKEYDRMDSRAIVGGDRVRSRRRNVIREEVRDNNR